MKPELKKISLALGSSLLAAGLSSCSLLGKNKYASQWEIQSDVPASLSSGQAATPSATAGTQAKSNLDGLSPAAEGALDLPGLENGTLSDIPKPHGATGEMANQSPPEMLSSQGMEGAGDLPYAAAAPHGLSTLLPAPPPAVREEELTLAPSALAAAEASVSHPPAEISLSPAETVTPTATPAPSIPLLYGKLDLAPFLNPPAPLAANSPPVPVAQ